MGDDIDGSHTESFAHARKEPSPSGTHYLGVVDYLSVVSSVSGIAVEEICVEEVVELARHALDAPAAERRDGPEPGDIYSGLVAKATVMCGRLLTEPPYGEDAGKIAYRCLEAFLLRNGAEWKEDPQRTVLHFNRVLASPGEASELLRWLGQRIAIPERAPSSAAGATLFNATDSAPVVVYLSGPLKGLPKAQLCELTDAREQVESATELVFQRTGSQVEIQLEHPSTRLSADAAPDYNAIEVWEFTSRQLIESVDALVVVDIAVETAGFGATSELDLHCLQEGPVLYLRSRSARHSRFLAARADELDLEIVSYGEIAELQPIVARWMLARWPAIRGAARRRGDRQIQYGPLKRRLETAWKSAPPYRRELAAHAAGMKAQALNRVLTSVALLSVLPAYRLDALCRELAVPDHRTHRQQVRIDAQAGPDYETLLQTAEAERWTAETTNTLYREAQRRTAGPRPYAPRARYRQMPDWKKLHRDLGL